MQSMTQERRNYVRKIYLSAKLHAVYLLSPLFSCCWCNPVGRAWKVSTPISSWCPQHSTGIPAKRAVSTFPGGNLRELLSSSNNDDDSYNYVTKVARYNNLHLSLGEFICPWRLRRPFGIFLSLPRICPFISSSFCFIASPLFSFP